MTDLHKALYQFWSGFSSDGKPLPVYLKGHVPANTAFPYITFEVVEGGAFGSTVLTAYGWFKAESGLNVNEQIAAFLDQVKAAIPPGGVKLRSGAGVAILYPNSSGFLSRMDDETNRDITAGRVSYEIYYYE